MSDIVERLRAYCNELNGYPIVCAEAADEVERLRAESEEFRRLYTLTEAKLMAAEKEIVRLNDKLLDRQLVQQRMAREIEEVVAMYKKLHHLVDEVRTLSSRPEGHA
jgi:hypothetical protein